MADLQPLLPRKIQQSIFPPVAKTADTPPSVDLTGMPGTSPSNILGTIGPPVLRSVSNPLSDQDQANNEDLYRREHPVKPTTTLGKIGHVFGGIGNALGDIFAPATMALIPGTQLYNERMIGRDKAERSQISDLETASQNRAQTAANTAYTEQKPEIAMAGLQHKMD